MKLSYMISDFMDFVNFGNYTIKSVLPLFILVGFISGVYHGIYNKEIYHPREKGNLGVHERIHTFWIHIVCGLAGTVCLYTLSRKYLFSHHNSVVFGSGDVGILLFGLIGSVGLGPMTLWFLVQVIIYSKDSLGRIIHLPKEPTQK